MPRSANQSVATMDIDIGKNSFHVVGLDQRGAIVVRQRWTRSQIRARLANMSPCLIGMEACVGAHHLSRRLHSLGHDARLMPGKYVKPYRKGQKNDFRDAEAIAEAVQRVLFVQAAWVVLIKPQIWERYGLKQWITAAKRRLHPNVLAIALANKLARIAWAV